MDCEPVISHVQISSDVNLCASEIAAIFENPFIDTTTWGGFANQETIPIEHLLGPCPEFVWSAPFLAPGIEPEILQDTQTSETKVDAINGLAELPNECSDLLSVSEDELKSIGLESASKSKVMDTSMGMSRDKPPTDNVEESCAVTSTIDSSDISEIKVGSQSGSMVDSQVKHAGQTLGMFSPVESVCLQTIDEESVESLNRKAFNDGRVSQSTLNDNDDDVFATHSPEMPPIPDLGTDDITATNPTANKLHGRGRKREQFHEGHETERIPRRSGLRSASTLGAPVKKRRLDKTFVDLNDHVKALRSTITAVLENLQQACSGPGAVHMKHLSDFHGSWTLHHTGDNASHRITPALLRALQTNLVGTLEDLPSMFPNDEVIRESCLDLERAFKEYDSLHLQLNSKPRPRRKRGY